MFHVMLYVFCGFQCICNDSTNSPFIKAFCNTPGVMSLITVQSFISVNARGPCAPAATAAIG